MLSLNKALSGPCFLGGGGVGGVSLDCHETMFLISFEKSSPSLNSPRFIEYMELAQSLILGFLRVPGCPRGGGVPGEP